MVKHSGRMAGSLHSGELKWEASGYLKSWACRYVRAAQASLSCGVTCLTAGLPDDVVAALAAVNATPEALGDCCLCRT